VNRRYIFYVTLAFVVVTANVSAKELFVYFGTYTNATSRGIYVSRLDTDSGKLFEPELAVATPSPCYLAISPDEKYLYAANSVKSFSGCATENGGAVSAFAIERPSGQLTLLNQECSGGSGPCHVSVDATGQVLFVANYGDGSAKAYRLETNGAIGVGGDRVARTGHSVNTNRQASAHAHFIGADPSNRFALVCDLGTDEVISYPFDANTARLNVSRLEVGGVPPGAGARHLAFRRDGKFVYVLNEMGCSVSRFEMDEKGRLYPGETIPALPAEVPVLASYTAAEILVSPDGKFVYATIRGHNSISVLAADAANGHLKLVQNIPCGGKTPRGLGLDPTGRWLFVANQQSGNVVEFSVDATTGRISPTGQELKIGSPVDVKFVR
jgi:6-phosphogluconolactonase